MSIMIEEDRELLCKLRFVNQGLAQSVVDLLYTMEDRQLAPVTLRRLADSLDGLVAALRTRATEVESTIDADEDDQPPQMFAIQRRPQ
jgi:hypothetical protein